MQLSAKELLGECERLVNIADEIVSRVDIMTSVSALKDSMYKLSESCNKQVWIQTEIDEMKEACSRHAIVLEYYLSMHNDEMKERYTKRTEVHCLYNQLCSELAKLSSSKNEVRKDELVSVAVARNLIKKIAMETCHIRFEVTQEEEKTINEAKELLEQLEERKAC